MPQLNERQREARSRGLGGSDAAVVCGFSPFKTPVQLWQEKTGRIPETNLDDKEIVQWGHLLEDVIAQETARRKGYTVHRVNEPRTHRAYDFMVANPDRRVVGQKRGLEVKNASWFTREGWGDHDTDDVPQFYLTQVVHYMAVFDWPAWDVGVLLGGNELRTYTVERDIDIEEQLVELERKFWQCVVDDTPPPPIVVEDLVRLYPQTHGAIVATEEIAQLVAECQRLAETRKAAEKRERELKVEIGAFMGEHGDLLDPVDPAITIATYRAHDESRIDVARFKLEQPALAADYTKVQAVRKFLVK
jgi:putative phage-type endonuclease